MSICDLPKLNKEIKIPKFLKRKIPPFLILTFFIVVVFGFFVGLASSDYFYLLIKDYLPKITEIRIVETIIEKETITEYQPQTSQEEKIIQVVEEYSPAVVSIIITKDLPVFGEYYIDPFGELFDLEFQVPQYRQKGTEETEIGGGTGFIISEDGMILTNKHVVLDTEADYTVFTNDGKKFSAKVLARDPFQDLAIIKINKTEDLKAVKLGDSDKLQIGQTVIAIGNVLGEFRNSVSVGIISGLGRTITASGGGLVETLEGVIQTDAAINQGNSGGPLLNLKGEVIGINTATVLEAQSIGFAIPINKAKQDIEQVKILGKIVYPFLGIRYVILTEIIQKENDLPVDYGALIIGGEEGGPAVVPGSAADKAGLKEGDIILEFNNEKITLENSLAKIIMKHNPGDRAVLRVLRDGKDEIIVATLDEKSE